MGTIRLLIELYVKRCNSCWKMHQAVEMAREALYGFDQLRTNGSESRRPLCKMVFNVPAHRKLTSSERAIRHDLTITVDIKATRDFDNMPPNIYSAAYLASQTH